MTISKLDLFRGVTDEYGEHGVLMRGLRYKEGLTRAQMAAKIGISTRMLTQIETGKEKVDKALELRLHLIFGVVMGVFES